MPSRALQEWRTTRRAELDRAVAAPGRFAGAGAEDRAMRQQAIDVAIVLLAAHFQRCCRELYEDAATFLAAEVQSTWAAEILSRALMRRVVLKRGTPIPPRSPRT